MHTRDPTPKGRQAWRSIVLWASLRKRLGSNRSGSFQSKRWRCRRSHNHSALFDGRSGECVWLDGDPAQPDDGWIEPHRLLDGTHLGR